MRTVTFKIVAVTKEGYTREIYVADEQQIRLHDGVLREGVCLPFVGMYLDPKDYPEADKFLIVRQQ